MEVGVRIVFVGRRLDGQSGPLDAQKEADSKADEHRYRQKRDEIGAYGMEKLNDTYLLHGICVS